MMDSNQNLIVFYCKTTCGHACLGQRVHMCVAEPAHVLELTTVVHFPRISQHHLVRLCCKLSFQTRCLKYPDTNRI